MHQSSVLSNTIPLYFFRSNIIYFDQKCPLKCKILRLSSARIKFLMSIFKQQVSPSPNFASFFIAMTHDSLVNFKLIYFLLCWKGAHLSANFECFQVLWWKFTKFVLSFSKPKSVFLQILHHSSVSWKLTPLYFFSSHNIYFAQKEPIKVKDFETFEC